MLPTRPHLLWLSCLRRACPSTVAKRLRCAGLVALSALCWLLLWPSSARAQVTGGSVIETNNSSISAILASDEIQNLPLSNRGYLSIVSLAPGVAVAAVDSERTSIWWGTPGGNPTMIGSKGSQVPNAPGYYIDSMNIVDGLDSTGRALVSFDANAVDGLPHDFLEIYTGTTFDPVIDSNHIAVPSTCTLPVGQGLRITGAKFGMSGTTLIETNCGIFNVATPGVATPIVSIGSTASGSQGGTYSRLGIGSVNVLGQALINAQVNVNGTSQPAVLQWDPSISSPLTVVAVSGNTLPGNVTIGPIDYSFQNDIGKIIAGFRSMKTSPYQIVMWDPVPKTLTPISLSGVTVPVPAGYTGNGVAGIITGVTDVHGFDNNLNIYFTGALAGNGSNLPFATSVLGAYSVGPTKSYRTIAYDKQPAPGGSGKTFNLANDFTFRYTFNGSLGLKFQYNEGGFGLFNQYGSNLLNSVVTDGQVTPYGGNWKLSNTLRYQIFDSGQIRYGSATSGGPKWVDTLAIPPATPGGNYSFTKNWSTDDLLPNSSTVYIGRDFKLLGNDLVYKAWRPGGLVTLFARDRMTGITKAVANEGDPVVGTNGYLGRFSECSPFSWDVNLQGLFIGDIYGTDIPARGILQAAIGMPLTKLIVTGDTVPNISGLTYKFRESFLNSFNGRFAYTDILSDDTTQVLGLYDSFAATKNQTVFSAPGTIGTTAIQSFKSESLRFSFNSLAIGVKATQGTNPRTGYFYLNGLTAPFAPQYIDGNQQFPNKLLRKISSNLWLNTSGVFNYLNNVTPTSYAISQFSPSLNTTTVLAQDGQTLTGAGNIAITGPDASGQLTAQSDSMSNDGVSFLLRSGFMNGTTNSGYSRIIGGSGLVPLILQGQTWTNFGVIGNIPAGTGNGDMILNLSDEATFSVPYTNSTTNKPSRALMWAGADGSMWKDFGTDDTFSLLNNKTITNYGPQLTSNMFPVEVGVVMDFSDGTQAAVTVLSTPGTNPTTTALPTSPITTTVGSPVTTMATVMGTPPVTGKTPSGNVALEVNGVESGQAVVNSAGSASFVVPALGAGTYSLTARYFGDTTFGISRSIPQQLIVTAIPTTTTVKSSLNPSGSGQAVTFTATVVGASSFSSLPSGMVSFYDGGTTLIGTGTLSNNTADYTTSTLSAGTHSITATYPGDSNYGTSTSLTPVSQVVNSIPSTTTLTTVSPNPATPGQNVTLTATVSTSTGGSSSGDVFFYDGTTLIDSAPTDATGKATIMPTFTAGTHMLTAVFQGNPTTGMSTSIAVTLTVGGSGGGASFTPPTPQTVTAGTPLNVNLTLNGTAGAVYNLSASNLPAYSSYGFSSNPVTIGNTGSVTFQFMLTTHAVTPPSQRRRPGAPFGVVGMELSLAAATLALLLAWWRFPTRLLARGTAMAVLVLVAVAIAGCNTTGGGGGGGGGGGSTPKGNAAIKIMAVPAAGGAEVDAIVNVNVQ